MRLRLFSRRNPDAGAPRVRGLLASCLFLAGAGLTHAAPVTILESHGPLSSTSLQDGAGQQLLLGGVLTRADEDTYLKHVNTGGDPAKVPGPERLHRAELNLGSALAGVKTVFSPPGYHVNEPSVFQPLNSPASYLVYVRGPNKTAEACRKKEEALRSCEAYLNARELALAESKDGGSSWEQKAVLVSAKDSGDESGPASGSALYYRGELWVYYATSKQSFMKENLFRLRVTLEGRRLAAPEAVTLEGFTPGNSLENPHVVRLKCPDSEKSVFTMVTNTRAMAALPLYWSEDGLKFRKVADSIVSSSSSVVTPTQLPGPASVEECHAASIKGVSSQRDLSWAEKGSSSWQLRRDKVLFKFP